MPRPRRFHLAAAALLLLLALALPLVAAADPRIELAAGVIDPAAASLPIDPGLRAALPDPDESAHWLVHWRAPLTPALKDELRGLGAALLGYLPQQAQLVRMTGAQAEAARALAAVDFVGLWHPAYALSPTIGQRVWQDPARAADGRLFLTVALFAGTDAERVAAATRKLDAELLALSADPAAPRLELALAPARLHELARLPGVQWIEDAPELSERNNNVVWIVQTAVSGNEAFWDHGLHGENQVLSHIDSGVAEASCYFDDPDGDPAGPNHRKVVYQTGSASTHGTHTAGTAVGNQTPVTGVADYNGVAYEAKLAISTYNAGGFNMYTTLVAHHGYGARVSTNSWGDDGTTAYTALCQDIDRYSHDFEEGLVAFAVTNLSTLKTPENAKNVLAVGATTNPDFENHGSGGSGPTADGRRKPEIYAPGCNNRSASTAACGTTSLCGTSMACPAIAGSALLARQFYTEGWYPSGSPTPADAFTPSGALLRATLLNGTDNMSGVAGYPSNREGWGHLILDEALAFAGDARGMWLQDVRNADGLQTGESVDYPLDVHGAGEALAATLVFTDPPATVGAAAPIINNLDLELIAPDATSYKGNYFSGGWSAAGGSFDALNTVERVAIASPAPGQWTLRVHGTNVPEGPQGFAVVVGGDVSGRVTSLPGEDLPLASLPRLAAPVPNPFNPKTSLRFTLPAAGVARLAIYDLSGRRLATLVDEALAAGEHVAEWNGRDAAGVQAASGVYLARLEAAGYADMRKLTLLK